MGSSSTSDAYSSNRCKQQQSHIVQRLHNKQACDGDETVGFNIVQKKYSNGIGMVPILSHQNDIFINELVGRHFQVERRRALANASRDIVV